MDSMEETTATLRRILEEDFGIKTDGDLLRALDKQRAIDLTPFCAEVIKPNRRKKRRGTKKKTADTYLEINESQGIHSCSYDGGCTAMR